MPNSEKIYYMLKNYLFAELRKKKYYAKTEIETNQ